MQRRQHPRVRLRLPARLRWSAPLGQRTEQCETENASRGGLLVVCSDAPATDHSLWVTFPFDAEASGLQPEMPARVVRKEAAKGRAAHSWKLGLRFEPPAYAGLSGNGQSRGEKKNGAGRNLALPIRVRPASMPWHEAVMTLEVSPEKVKFVTNREYAFGERLLVSFDSRSDAPWSGDEEWEGEVSGIEMDASSDAVTVTVRRKSAAAEHGKKV